MQNKFYLLIFSFLLFSCRAIDLKDKDNSNVINEDLTNSVSLLEELKTNNEFLPSDSYKKFSNLPEYEKIKEVVSSGREDPFSSSEHSFSDLNKYIKLVGIYDLMNKKYALIRFDNKELEILEGYEGSDKASMLPKGVKLIKVDTNGRKIILDYNGQETEITLFEYI
tara:strand:- start:84 stop:584 length:501 start_codon:yes stop_codon:yes gene_type:complete